MHGMVFCCAVLMFELELCLILFLDHFVGLVGRWTDGWKVLHLWGRIAGKMGKKDGVEELALLRLRQIGRDFVVMVV
jgi:hypothetical protein